MLSNPTTKDLTKLFDNIDRANLNGMRNSEIMQLSDGLDYYRRLLTDRVVAAESRIRDSRPHHSFPPVFDSRAPPGLMGGQFPGPIPPNTRPLFAQSPLLPIDRVSGHRGSISPPCMSSSIFLISCGLALQILDIMLTLIPNTDDFSYSSPNTAANPKLQQFHGNPTSKPG